MMHTGSSPHMRGKRFLPRTYAGSVRIIPAHAGQTHCRCLTATTGMDHPRTCGANIMVAVQWVINIGSSPHMRGKQEMEEVPTPTPRIIPAHAGQTSYSASSVARSSDHPRTCGANGRDPGRGRQRAGSSPHMRGKLDGFRAGRVDDRIIPAHAGQTRPALRR